MMNSDRPIKNVPRSAKNHTCYFWSKGHCKFDEANCLYAHHDTGIIADEPVCVEQGRPAVAGRNAQAKTPIHFDWRGIQIKTPPGGSASQDQSIEEGEISREDHDPWQHGRGMDGYQRQWQGPQGPSGGTPQRLLVRAATATNASSMTGLNSTAFSTSPVFTYPRLDLESQLRQYKVVFDAQARMLEECIVAVEIGREIIFEERASLVQLSRSAQPALEYLAGNRGRSSRTVPQVAERIGELGGDYRTLVGEIRGKQRRLARDMRAAGL